ncbi:MAG: glycine zipper 2TM domain-containing protein [Gammaproteobacteria bacterium]|nr:glycine zipper 2TM domain-containing protein [Gammaproteobacteria bacterium]
MKNMNKTLLVLTTMLTIIFSATASAEHKERKQNSHRHDDHNHYAKVVHVEPIYKIVHVAYPEQVCWQDEVRKPVIHRANHASPEAMIVGGILGGVIGHELGKNHDQGITTVAGALIGTAIASETNAQYYRTGEYRIEQRQHCRIENQYRTEQQLRGYRVTFRYKGELYTTRMKHHPGKHIPVDVRAAPVHRM